MKTVILSLCFVLLYWSSSAQPRDIETINGTKIKAISLNKFISQQLDSLHVPGLSIAIIQNNQIVYQGAFGVKNNRTKEKVTSETIFEAASISKPIFAYFVMKEVEKGILELDTPLYKYYSDPQIEKNENYRLLTTRMVLCQASGFENWRKNDSAKLIFQFQPGTRYGYSGEGYQCLERAIAHKLQVTDIELDGIFKKEIAGAIHAKHMGFTWDRSFASLKAYGHRNGTPTDNDSQGPPDWFNAAGGLHISAVDYAKVLIQIMKEAKAGNPEITEMLSIQRDMPNEAGELHRSIAFPVKNVNGKIRFYHSGNNGDFRAYCHFYKDKQYGIVMLNNCDNFFSSNCAKDILEFLGDKWYYM